MPSYLHELLLILFRNHSGSAADLLRKLDVQLPQYDEIRTESSDINDLKPAEYRADLVLFLVRGKEKVLGVVVEVQLAYDEDKPYAWPAYVANLRSRHRCPVCLLVITLEESVARWAGKPIELGPGTRCKPWVVGPSNTPAVTELQHAQQNVELAVLSAVEHGNNPDVALAARIAAAAIVASADIDNERCRLYHDLIQISLSLSAWKALEATMSSVSYERYQAYFEQRYFALGRTEGRVDLILRQLAVRFGPLPDRIQTSVRGAQNDELDTLAERLLTAPTLEQALGSLYFPCDHSGASTPL